MNKNKVADHPNPCMGMPPDVVFMFVDLAPFGLPGRFERFTTLPSPVGNHVVACLPFFTRGIQFGDLVEVTGPENLFQRVIKTSGLRTFRVAFKDKAVAARSHEELHGRIAETGFPHEWCGTGYLAVLIRNWEDQKSVSSCVESHYQADNICWEVDPEPFAEATS